MALGWNVLQHFYPYFDVVGTDWPAALREAIAAAAADPDGVAFLTTLRRMIAALNDGHGGVYSSSGDDPLGGPPLAWDWVEDKLVVTFVPAGDKAPGVKLGDIAQSMIFGDRFDLLSLDIQGVKPGDVVQAIDGRPVADCLADAGHLISAATPQWRRYRALQRLGAGEPGSEVALEVAGDGAGAAPRTVRLRRVALHVVRPEETRPPKVHELKPGVFYVDINRIDDEDLRKALPDLEKARGIVFDFRGYPYKLTSPQTFFGHLTDKPITSPQWHVPRVRRPDGENVEFRQAIGWSIPRASRI